MSTPGAMPGNGVCGLDEVGRGALAGPLVAAAAVLPPGFDGILGSLRLLLRDSKTLSRAQRERIAEPIRRAALNLAIVEISVEEIDRRGIAWANREAFRRLIALIDAGSYVVDGNLRLRVEGERMERVRSVVRADATEPAVSAASIVAKVHRDRLMADLAGEHPEYGWDHNAGYGTPEHIAALREHGPTSHHRALFTSTALGRYLGDNSLGRATQPAAPR
jgi:ribonuclease HII